jgi:peroxiredoxin
MSAGPLHPAETHGGTGPAEGQPAPDFELQASGGAMWRLGALRGQRHAVLLFYILDWTPG